MDYRRSWRWTVDSDVNLDKPEDLRMKGQLQIRNFETGETSPKATARKLKLENLSSKVRD